MSLRSRVGRDGESSATRDVCGGARDGTPGRRLSTRDRRAWAREMNDPSRCRSVAGAGLWLALAAVLWACAGVEDQAHAYYEAEYLLARRIELDPADEARFLRSFADGLERDQAGFVHRARAVGALEGVFQTRPEAVVAEWRARAAAMEADPVLYVLTMRRAADAVAARFEPKDRPWPRANDHPCFYEPGGCSPKRLPRG